MSDTHKKEDRQEDRQEHRQDDMQAVGQSGRQPDEADRQTVMAVYDFILVSLSKPELYSLLTNTLA